MVTGFEKLNLMKKKCSYFIGFVLLVAGIISGFKTYEITLLQDLRIEPTQPLFYDVQTEEVFEYCASIEENELDIPFTGKTFTGFKQALAVRESLGIYTLVNPFGYMGKYQFGKSALRSVGIYDASDFLENPIKQEKAFEALLAKNKWELRKEIRQYDGRRIAGIVITESGLLAAAHLGGAFSVKKFLKSNGSAGFRDGFGTSIRTYLKKFAGYDTSHIIANSNPVVLM